MYKKWLILATCLLSVANVYAAYPEVECSVDTAFTDYSCNQCFDWWEVKSKDNISFLDDLWVNDSLNDKVMFKAEQKMPKFYELNGAKYSTNPTDEKLFWEFPTELTSLTNYSWTVTNWTKEDSHILTAWKSVTWLKSTLWSAYRMDSVPAKWKSAWILVYDLKSHDIVWENIARNETPHRECVVFKSWEAKVATPTPSAPTETPKPQEITKVKTWPELYFAVVILSFLMSMVLLNRKTILSYIRK